LGYGELGCYGQEKIKTPNLDRLAAEGMRFTQFYAGSTVCAPSRATLMTGLHTGHAFIRGNEQLPLRPQDLTVAEVLKGAGYKTAIFGKWGLGKEGTTGVPNQKGFDEWLGYLDQVEAHNYYPETLWRNSQRFAFPGNMNHQKSDYSHNWFTRAATNFIETYYDKPLFLYLAYTIPHANNELGQVTKNGMEVPSDAPYTNEPWPQTEKNKAAMITLMDRDIGRIVEVLQARKLERDTLVIFTSDNGPHKEGGANPAFFKSAGPLRGIKRDLYEGGIRVPFIAWWPGHIKPGSVSDSVGAFWDFLPTAAELAKAKPPEQTDGISLVPVLLGEEPKQRHDFLYWEFHENGSKQAVRMGDWKAVRLEPGKPLELYNLKNDASETNNIAASQPAIVARIEGYLKTARTESETWPLKSPPPPKTVNP
ncbi:MAG TPA: arylsulfatase, partial [Verrucomicrobiae bacterium]|nr:arylsulfatase [Verrucomicrobiae bacterium]